MKGYRVYTGIQQLKELGFSKRNVARQLGISRDTVTKYWDMNPDTFEQQLRQVNRHLLLSHHESIILTWLRQYPSLSAAQVCDWLKEHYQEDYTERTVSRYVHGLRQKYHLSREQNPRDYEAVEEMPPGKQAQVDFGEKYMQDVNGGRTKVVFVAFVLSHSRDKYVDFLDRPFTTTDLVAACHRCFQYYGGMPRELVFDQDSVVSVSENYGDIIHTYEFEKFRQECGFKVYLCRKADPETKGKIERVVQYVKGNFLENRMYPGDTAILQACALDWLERTANAKPHGMTKRIPREVWQEEREYLLPLPSLLVNQGVEMLRTVRKDNTVVFDSNRYSLPLGTYNAQKEVALEVADGKLLLRTTFGDLLCEHPIATGRGQLVKSNNHSRDRSSPLDAMQSALDEHLGYEATAYLSVIRTEMSRYARDQFMLLNALSDQYGAEMVLVAIHFCEDTRLVSATYVRDYLKHGQQPHPAHSSLPIPVSDSKYHVVTQKRPLSVYAKAGDSR